MGNFRNPQRTYEPETRYFAICGGKFLGVISQLSLNLQNVRNNFSVVFSV